MTTRLPGLIGGALYGGAALGWLVAGSPPGPRWAYAAWFLALIGVGILLPGVANQVTLARAYLALPALGFAISPGGVGGLALTVALAGLTDLVDGTLARRFDQPTRLGGALDPVVDGIYYGAVATGLAIGGAYPLWLAVLVVGRYLLPALAGALLLALGRRPEIRHTLFGQVSTSLIAVLLGWIALFRGLGQDTRLVVTGAEVVLPLASLATLANLYWVNRGSVSPRPG